MKSQEILTVEHYAVLFEPMPLLQRPVRIFICFPCAYVHICMSVNYSLSVQLNGGKADKCSLGAHDHINLPAFSTVALCLVSGLFHLTGF